MGFNNHAQRSTPSYYLDVDNPFDGTFDDGFKGMALWQLWLSLVFLCLYYTDPFNIPSMNVTWEFYRNSRQTKKFKKTMKSLNSFWKKSIFTTLFWLSLSKWYRNIPHNAETFWKIKKLPGQSENFPDILQSFHTIWKLQRVCWKWRWGQDMCRHEQLAADRAKRH